MVSVALNADTIVHLRFRGESREVQLGDLGLARLEDDDRLLAALAHHFDLSLDDLQRECVVERGERAIVIRPKAVFG